jgi:cellulose biosynthesis protein BcsQ
MRVVTVINAKGGCGKSTIAMNLAAALAGNGYRTLLLDLDPQAQLPAAMGLGFGHAMNELIVAELLEALQSSAVRAFDLHLSIQRETSAVVPARHLAHVGGVEMAGTGEPAQHPSARLLLRRRRRPPIEDAWPGCSTESAADH